jgi:hypothetical protein
MKQIREGWGTRKFNGINLSGVEECGNRPVASQKLTLRLKRFVISRRFSRDGEPALILHNRCIADQAIFP